MHALILVRRCGATGSGAGHVLSVVAQNLLPSREHAQLNVVAVPFPDSCYLRRIIWPGPNLVIPSLLNLMLYNATSGLNWGRQCGSYHAHTVSSEMYPGPDIPFRDTTLRSLNSVLVSVTVVPGVILSIMKPPSFGLFYPLGT